MSDDYDITQSKLRARMTEAQDSMRRQEIADEAKSKLCDQIQRHKNKNAKLKVSIENLEYNDPELYKYIRQLEYVQAGIWCDACAAGKQIHHNIDGVVVDRVVDNIVPIETKHLPKSALDSFRERANQTSRMVHGKPVTSEVIAKSTSRKTNDPVGIPVGTPVIIEPSLLPSRPILARDFCFPMPESPKEKPVEEPKETKYTIKPKFNWDGADTETSVMQNTINDLVRRVTALESHGIMPTPKVSFNPPPQNASRASIHDFLGVIGTNNNTNTTPNVFGVNDTNPFSLNDGFIAESSAVRPFIMPANVTVPSAVDMFADFSTHH